MTRFKFRADCDQDVQNLVAYMQKNNVPAVIEELEAGLIDCDRVIMTGLRLDEVREVMNNIEDGHTMVQTVRDENNYTGIRNYSF